MPTNTSAMRSVSVRQRVPGARRDAVGGQRDVDGLLDEDARVALGLELGTRRSSRRLAHPGAGLTHALAGVGLRAAGGRAPISRLARASGLAVADVLEADALERVEVGGGGERRRGPARAPRRRPAGSARPPPRGRRTCSVRTWGNGPPRSTAGGRTYRVCRTRGPAAPAGCPARRHAFSPASALITGKLDPTRCSRGSEERPACLDSGDRGALGAELAYRQTAAAVARLRLSARPCIGTRTTASTRGERLVGQAPRLVAEHPGGRRREPPGPASAASSRSSRSGAGAVGRAGRSGRRRAARRPPRRAGRPWPPAGGRGCRRWPARTWRCAVDARRR